MRYFKLALICFIALSFISVDYIPNSVRVFVVQDSLRKEILSEGQIVKLKRKPFHFEFQFRNNVEGISLIASYSDEYYKLPSSKKIDDKGSFGGRTVVESKYNEDKEVIIDHESVSYWYYEKDPSLPHRLDKKVIITDTLVTATHEITNVFDNQYKKEFRLTQLKQPIYFVFFNYQYTPDYKKYDVYDRKKVKLEWE